MNFTETFNKFATNAKVFFKANSPTIAVVVGCIGSAAAVGLAIKATTKLNDKLDIHKAEIDAAKMDADNHYLELDSDEQPTEEVIKNDKKAITKAYVSAVLDISKLYAPVVIVEALSLASIIYSHSAMKKRTIALSSALAATTTAFKNYRKRVIETYGEEVDKNFRHNIREEVIVEEKVDEETGEVKTETKNVLCADYSMFARIFDETNPNWQRDAETNKFFLKSMQNYWNNKLAAEGKVFLNDVLESLGFDGVKEGQFVGWRYDPNDSNIDSFIDFGLYSGREAANLFINGNEYSVLLDFNIDGDILDKVYTPSNK